MDRKGLLADLTDKTVDTIFMDFMTRCAMLEELVDAGERFLRGFIREVVHSCKLGLEDHLVKAKVLLDELESLKDNATGIITDSIDEHLSDFVFNCPEDNKTLQSHSVQEDARESLLPNESLFPATLMTIIFSMLKLEFTMQDNIIRSLNLMTSSSELESYSLFWELRPDVDDNIMHQAWKCVSG